MNKRKRKKIARKFIAKYGVMEWLHSKDNKKEFKKLVYFDNPMQFLLKGSEE